VLRDLRNEVRCGGPPRGSPALVPDELERWYNPLNAYTSIGPTVQRSRSDRAMEAGSCTGRRDPDRPSGADGASWWIPRWFPGEPVRYTAIEARLPETDLRRSREPAAGATC